jgi:hypothetical protein
VPGHQSARSLILNVLSFDGKAMRRLEVHVGISKQCVLKQKGTIPIQLGAASICHLLSAESLTANIITELRERLESTDSYEEPLGLITEMEEIGGRDIVITFLKFTQSGVETPD